MRHIHRHQYLIPSSLRRRKNHSSIVDAQALWGMTMDYGFRKLSTRTKLAAAALALAFAGVLHAQTLVGGGATLPSSGYLGSNAGFDNLQMWDGAGSTATIATGSLFGQYIATSGNPNISYCLTGSGAGKDILASPITLSVNGLSTEFNVQNPCVKNGVGTVAGFGAGLTGVNRLDLTQPNFVATDSPLSASDYTNYVTSHAASGAYPVQFPSVAGTVAIAFNLKDSEGNQVTSSEVNFTDAQLCEIFSGEVITWNDSRLTSAFTLPTGDSIPSEPINVQYRSDGSGTTFSLSNHLANVCGTVNGSTFETSQTFFSSTASPSSPDVVFRYYSTAVPSNWTGSSGDVEVAEAVFDTANSIGYVETATALAINPPLQFADVNGASPVTNFAGTLDVRATAVVFNEVISATNATNGTAQLEAIGAISGVTNPPPNTLCIAVVKPSIYDKAGIPGGVLPSGSYPIVAISYLLGNAIGNGPDLANTQNLLAFPYTVTQSNVTTIGPGTGLAFLTLTGTTPAYSATSIKACLTQ
jgi:phosphate transport system substrate-binding protein